MTEAPTLYLIDGHAQIFRAYYAIRSRMSSPVTGEPTHAVFAFAGMLLKLLKQCHPTHVAMAIDLPGPTFRDALYPDYKATRDPPPEDFHPQEQRILELVTLFGIPILSHTGAEADDVIATVTRRVLRDDPDVRVRIVSRDKDLEQLLGPRVTLYDIHTDATLDTDSLLADKGIRPDQVVDLLMLMGDTVDNIPGVEGVGPKTAAALVSQFGSVEGVYANLEQIKGKRRENLEAARDRMTLNRLLVTLKEDLDLAFTLDAAKLRPLNAPAIGQVFKTLGFNRHQADLASLTAPAKPAKPHAEPFTEGLFSWDAPPLPTDSSSAPDPARSVYQTITTHEQLDQLVATLRQQKLIAVDTETVGLGARADLCGVCLSWEPGQGVYVPVRSPDPSMHLDASAVLTALRPVLEDASIGKVGHHIKYDARVLLRAGVRLRGVVMDTMIAAFLTGEPGLGMDALSQALLGYVPIPITALIGHKERGQTQKTMDQVELSQITAYAAEDADVTLRLYHVLRPKVEALGMTTLCDTVETPLIDVLTQMEHTGIRVDPAVLDAQRDELQKQAESLRRAILDAAGVDFNPDSPKQLADVLFNHLKLPVVKRTRTGPSTDIEVLTRLAEDMTLTPQQRQLPTLIVEYRQLTKLINTYLVALVEAIDPADGRVHASFHQTGAATGRLSSSDPNLQNIPIRTDVGRQIRRAFVAPPGSVLISADYSQVELRILAHLSQDPGLIDAFERDQDIHSAVAMQVFGVTDPALVTPQQRTSAKTINFGIIYGVTPFGLSRRIEGLDLKAAESLIASYKQRFPGIDRFLIACVEQAKAHGYVTTMLGRRRAIEQVHARNPMERALGERLAINTVVQGSAADLIKLAMVNLHRRIEDEPLPMKMLLQIHDELVLECPAEQAQAMAAVVVQAMQSAMTLRVPLKVEAGVGPDWYNAK